MGCCAVEWHEFALGVMLSLLIPMLLHLTLSEAVDSCVHWGQLGPLKIFTFPSSMKSIYPQSSRCWTLHDQFLLMMLGGLGCVAVLCNRD